jgi:hypothetical protein
MSKRGQIATTATWVAGTLVIIVILGIFLFVTSSLSGVKQLTPSQISSSNVDPKTSDLFLSKSFSAYLLSEENGRTMYSGIQSTPYVFDKESNALAEKLFLFIYPSVSRQLYSLHFRLIIYKPNAVFEDGGKRNLVFPDEGVSTSAIPTDIAFSMPYFLNLEKSVGIALRVHTAGRLTV